MRVWDDRSNRTDVKGGTIYIGCSIAREIHEGMAMARVGESIAMTGKMVACLKMSQKDARGEVSIDIRLQFQA